ncbi:MAG: 50S ribosomal protein L4 [Patescibacteria group bacterium]
MKVDIYNTKKEKVGEISLKKEVFGCDFNENLVSQYVRVYLANQRRGTAKTKTRAEVSGGGVKPWKQKGTGRARHGSIRSPIWVHGGVAHGPKPKDWSLKMPQKMRTSALFSVLSDKARGNKIIVLEDLKFNTYSAKKMAGLLKDLEILGKVGLVIPKGGDDKINKSARNIKDIFVKPACELNAFYVLSLDTLIIVKPSLDIIYDTFLK